MLQRNLSTKCLKSVHNMDCKTKRRINKRLNLLFVCIIAGLISGCSARDEKVKNIYYIELINFSDSLSNYISANSFGKVAFYKKNELKIISQNFITEEYPDMHYISSIDAVEMKEVEPGAKKIRVEFIKIYSVDSIKYALSKYSYRENKWNKISDLGIVKGVTTFKRAREFYITEFGKQIINNMITYTYE